MKRTALWLLVLAMCLGMSNCPGVTSGIEDDEQTPVKYAAEFRGEWIRMDNGDRWYISGSSIKVNGAASDLDVTLERASDNVVTAATGSQKHTLFAARVANAGFNAQVVFLDEGGTAGGAARSSQGASGQMPPVRIVNPQQPDMYYIVEPDPETGQLKILGVIPGDKLEIIPEDALWKYIKVDLFPGYGEDQNMGVIPLTNGDNFKVSIRMQDPAIDINELYADGIARNYIIELENIGKTNCGDGGWELSWDNNDFQFISGKTSEDFVNIAPGGKRQFNVQLASKKIDNEKKNKEITIGLWNYDSVSKKTREWDDTVSVNYFGETVPFNFKSENHVQGVIKSKNGKSYYFKTSRTGAAGDFGAVVNVPWSDDEYTIAFLGASIEAGTATKYSFAINADPPAAWESLRPIDFLRQYKPDNADEATAPKINLSAGENSFMGYLAGDSIDYYKVKLGSLTETRSRTVAFNANGGSGTVQAITREPGTVIQLPAQGSMERSGYVFKGWNTSSTGAGTAYAVGADYAISGNATLYAAWECTVTFDANGGSGTAPASQTVNAGAVITLPYSTGLSKSGYLFYGWNTKADGSGTNYDASASFAPDGNTTLFARWEMIVYTVTFNANGGSGTAPAPQKADYGTAITLPDGSDLSRSGYNFTGWNTLANGNGAAYSAGASYTPSANITLYAQWIQIFTVTFNANGGSGIVPDAIPANSGSSITLPDGSSLSRSGYNFTGWNTLANGNGAAYSAGASYTPSASITLYAQWIEIFTVTFNANGGSGIVPDAISANSGSSITLPDQGGLTMAGYNFTGWNTQANGTGTAYAAGVSYAPSGNITLHAQWIIFFTVTFDANGADGTAPDAQTANAGSSVILASGSSLAKDGFLFIGWNTNAVGTGTNYAAGSSYTVTGDVTLYARWIKGIISSSGIEMVFIPGGSFVLGRELGTAATGDVTPVSTVTLTGFYMGKYQVTQEQYQAVMGSNPSSFSSNPTSGEVQARRPVENVSWYDAIVFCNKLSMKEGLTPAYRISGSTDPAVWGTVPTSSNTTWDNAAIVSGSTGYRLPTEAQWEYAAKGGPTPDNTTYAGSNDPGTVAWYSDNSNSMTHEVGKKAPNGLGLYDMSGNVIEWCWDWLGSYTSGAKTDPMGAVSGSYGSYRVGRGGSWAYDGRYLRSAYRDVVYLFGRGSNIGFRLVRP